jgi:hypothetical protein
VDTEGAQFSSKLRNCILNDRYLQLNICLFLHFINVEGFEQQEGSLELKRSVVGKYLYQSKSACVKEDESNQSESEDDEEKASMQRVLSYLAAQPTQGGHKPQEAGDRQGRAAGWQVREAAAEKSDQLHPGAGRMPPNSSDEEVPEITEVAGNVRAGPCQDVSRDNGLATTQCDCESAGEQRRGRVQEQAVHVRSVLDNNFKGKSKKKQHLLLKISLIKRKRASMLSDISPNSAA